MFWAVIGILAIGLIGIIAFAGALAAALALLRLLAELALRLLLGSVLAVSVGLLATAAAANLTEVDPVPAAVLLAIVSWVPATMLIWRWRGSLLHNVAAEGAIIEGPAASSWRDESCFAHGDQRPVIMEPAGDEAIGAAWENAAMLAPEYAERLRTAREKCAKLLCLEGLNLDAANSQSWLELATLIRRHVEPLVSETRRACDGAPASECSESIAQMALKLEQLGDRAGELLEVERECSREGLALRHAHLDQRLRGSSTW